MTSIANKNAYNAVSASLKLSDKSVINKHSNSVMCESGANVAAVSASAVELQAETIEVVPEIPTFNDSGDEFSEYSDENDMANSFNLNNMDDDDDDDEPFDEYGKKI